MWRTATPDEVWLACRSKSNECGWVRLPDDTSVFSWEPTLYWPTDELVRGDDVPAAELHILPARTALALVRDSEGRLSGDDIWEQLGRLTVASPEQVRLLGVVVDPNVPVGQLLLTLHRLEVRTDAVLHVSVSEVPLD